MNAPTWFQEQLRLEFPHLRIRWSVDRQCFQIEQKVGRAAFVPFKVSEIDDETIRAKDGYILTMEVRPGDRMPCRFCHLPLKVPALECAQIICGYCRSRGRDSSTIAGYWPLDESLLEHLRFTDPFRGGIERVMKKIKDSQKRRDAANDKAELNIARDAMLEGLLTQIPRVGYTTNAVFTG